MKTIEFLRAKEWSMGNGQCPECCGAHQGWLGHPLHLDASGIGHKADCPLAASLRELGASPVVMVGEFKSDKVYEIDPTCPFLKTRLRSAS